MGIGLSVLAAAEDKKNATESTKRVTEASGVSVKSQTGAGGGGTQTTTEKQPSQSEGAPKEHIDQCDLEDDDDYEDFELEPGIRTSFTNEVKKSDFQRIIDSIFSEKSLSGKRVKFRPCEILSVIEEVQIYLDSEPMLIEDVPFGVTIVGDLHGQLHDLHRVFTADSKDGKPGWLCTKYLFLGDYVDRGRQSLEILMALCCLKCLYPDRIFLLRGNHEFGVVNMRYGFPTENQDRFKEGTAEFLYYKWNELFCYLSVAAIVGGKYFCAHGGISTSGFTRRQLKRVTKPFINTTEDSLIHDIVWSDPAKGLRGASFNAERQSSVYYGLDVLAHALASMQCIALFRAHSMLNEGYEIIGNMCISIFTATGGKNNGSVAVIADDGKMLMRVLETDLDRVLWEQRLKKIDGRINVDKDEELTVAYDEDTGTGKLKDF